MVGPTGVVMAVEEDPVMLGNLSHSGTERTWKNQKIFRVFPSFSVAKNRDLSPVFLFIIYFILSLSILVIWNIQGRHTITGDEPHYLVIASGVIRHGTLEQTVPYQEELEKKKIFRFGIDDAHTVQGPNGSFSIHSIGLPLLISLPFFLGGVLGAKLFMILTGGMAVVIVWKISGLFNLDPKIRFSATFITCIALPLVPCSNQIYPDLIAGVIALGGIYWFMTTTVHRSLIKEVFWIGSIAFLPWLQIKFAAACLLLTVFLIWKIYHESRNIGRVLLIFVITAFSLIMLAVYNDYAFGKFSGPYQSDALEISKNALMVFMGLHFDQNQGFLFQNPVMFIGLFAIGALFAHSQSAALLCLLVFLSFITPNAMHPNWYGGASFSGRFSWSAAVIFFLPTVFGLIKLAQNHIKSFWIVVISSTSLQIYFFYQYLFLNTDLYSKSFSTWFSNYSMYYFPIDSYMPALYNADWAYVHGPNYGWIILIFLIIFLGFKKNKDYGNPGKISRKTTSLVFLAGLLMIFTPGFTNQSSHHQKIAFIGKDLPSLSGQIRGTLRVAMAGTDHSGFVTFGPYLPLRRGSYRVTLRYSSSAPVEQSVGVWDVFDANESVQIAVYPLSGTAGQAKVLEASFKTHNWNSHRFEFRNYWNGVADLHIHEIGLRIISGTDHASP